MSLNKLNITLLLSIFCFGVQSLFAQDLHLAQYYNSPLNTSPALSGMFPEDFRIYLNHRRQWESLDANFLTGSITADFKISPKKSKSGYFGLGTVLNYDNAGFAPLTTMQGGLNLAYIRPIGKNHFLSGAFQVSGNNRSIKFDNFTFDNQFNGTKFDPNRQTNESLNPQTKWFIDFGLGINYRYQMNNRRTKVDAGFGLFHINNPTVSFLGDPESTLARRLNIYVMSQIKVVEAIDVVLNVNGNFTSPVGFYNQILAGGGVKFYLGDTNNMVGEKSLMIGALYRLGDAVIPTMEIQVNRFKVGLSYDLNISDFTKATNRAAGPEVSLRYAFGKAKTPLEENNKKGKGGSVIKSCPIF